MVAHGHLRLVPSLLLWGCMVALPALLWDVVLYLQLVIVIAALAWGGVSWHIRQLQQCRQAADQPMWRVCIDDQERSMVSGGRLAEFAIEAWTTPALYRQQLWNVLQGVLHMAMELATLLPAVLFWCVLAGLYLVRANPFDLFAGLSYLVTTREPLVVFGALGAAALIIWMLQLSRLLNDPTVYGFHNCFWLHQQRAIRRIVGPRMSGEVVLIPIPRSRPKAGDLTTRTVS